MFRVIRYLAVALACAGVAVVAVPASPVAADGAKVSLQYGYYDIADQPDGSLVCAFGRSISISGHFSGVPDSRLATYEWSGNLGGEIGRLSSIYEFDCDFEGTRELGLRAYNENGEASIVVQVTANGAPEASISPSADPPTYTMYVPLGTSVTFTANATDPEGAPLEPTWYVEFTYIPDDEIHNPTFTIDCDWEKNDNIAFEVVDDVGLRGGAGLSVYCIAPVDGGIVPKPTVSGRRTVVPRGTKIDFTAQSRSVFNDYEWRTTGVDGIADSDYKYTRTFDQLGDYGVQLTETSEFATATTWVGYTVVDPPTVAVSPTPADPKARMRVPLGSTVTFDGSGSTSPGGGSLSYRWLTTGTSGVAGDGVRFARKFDQTGNFGVELTVENEVGQTAKRWVGVTVFKSEPPVVSVTPAPKDPKARITVNVGDTVTFDGRRSRDPDGGALTYQWRSTGVRGVAGTANSYSRKFDKPGLYGVELIVIDDEGQRAKRWVGVNVAR